MIASQKAIKQINGIRHENKKIQRSARVAKFEELLQEQIEGVIKKKRVPATEEIWQLVFRKLRTWFLDVQKGVDDPMSSAAFHQHWYLIREKITNDKEKARI